MDIVIAENATAAREHFDRIRAEQNDLGKRIARASQDEKHLFVAEAKSIAERLRAAKLALETSESVR